MTFIAETTDIYPNIHQNHAKIRAEIDAQVALLKAQITSLLATRNTSIPVGLLPSEVLEQIFKGVKMAHEGVPNKLLTLTWVCRHWRSVAINYAHLWTHIDSSNASWGDECIHRSKCLPLTVHLSARSPISQTVLSQLPRIRNLRFQASSYTIVGNVWTKPAHLLETLVAHWLILPPNVFSGTTPCLREMELVGCKFTWEWIASLYTLTALSIDIPGNRLTPSRLLSVLGDLPNLTTFTLSSALDSDPETEEVQPILLPQMVQFRLFDVDIRIATHLIRMASMPNASLHIEGLKDQFDQERYLQLVSTAFEHFPLPPHSLSISRTPSVTHGTRCGIKYSSPESDRSIILGQPLYTTIQDILPPDSYLAQLRRLTLDISHYLPPQTWTERLSTLPNLEHLELSKDASPLFHGYIKEFLSSHRRLQPERTTYATPPFSKLRFIKFTPSLYRAGGSEDVVEFFLLKKESGYPCKRWVIPWDGKEPSELSELVERVGGGVDEIVVENADG